MRERLEVDALHRRVGQRRPGRADEGGPEGQEAVAVPGRAFGEEHDGLARGEPVRHRSVGLGGRRRGAPGR